MSKYYKGALYIAAEYAFNDEVVVPDMIDSVIGKDCDFETKEEWIQARVDEWLEEAALKRGAK